MRSSNKWGLATQRDVQDLVDDKGIDGVADKFGVNETTVRAWLRGVRAPNRRFQAALANSAVDFASLSAADIGRRISTFMRIHDLATADLADALKVSEATVGRYLNGESRPRSLRQLAGVLSESTF